MWYNYSPYTNYHSCYPTYGYQHYNPCYPTVQVLPVYQPCPPVLYQRPVFYYPSQARYDRY